MCFGEMANSAQPRLRELGAALTDALVIAIPTQMLSLTQQQPPRTSSSRHHSRSHNYDHHLPSLSPTLSVYASVISSSLDLETRRSAMLWRSRGGKTQAVQPSLRLKLSLFRQPHVTELLTFYDNHCSLHEYEVSDAPLAMSKLRPRPWWITTFEAPKSQYHRP
jgi:hypothetical protein